MTAYYNEIDPFAAEWLRNLIAAGHIAPGDVDERSIEDVKPDELRNYTQCHFFAGIGVWSYALRNAGWPDDRPVWTGSCPCQPFSAAGKRGGTDDERHLWPAWFHLVEQCRPATVFGEQVASKDGLGWLDLVQADLETAGYACGFVDTCSAGSGAPHIRQRLRFVAKGAANADIEQRNRSGHAGPGGWGEPANNSAIGQLRGVDLADAYDARLEGREGEPERSAELVAGPGSVAGGLADADGGNASAEGLQRSGQHGQQPTDGSAGWVEHPGGERWEWREEAASRHVDDRAAPFRSQGQHGAGEPSTYRLSQDGAGPTNGFWRDADWLFCRDGKWRPVESGTFPLAHGAPQRVGRLRAYGNAVDAEATRIFIEAYRDTCDSI